MRLRRHTPADGASPDWAGARRALRDEVDRVVSLLRSVPSPDVAALGQWNVAEVAMHLSQGWLAVPGLANGDLSGVHQVLPGLEGTAGPSMIRDLWELGDVTRMGVREDPERDLQVLADRIADRAEQYFTGLAGSSAGERRAWLVEGAEVTYATLTFHLLSETVVHGWDIATAVGRRWEIKPAHAVLILEGFLVPVLQALGSRDMVDQQQAAGLRATYEIRLRGGGRHVFVFDDGALTVERPSPRPVDCIIAADPVALLLVAWGRRNQAPAVVRRQLVVSGPRPWLGPRFRALMRNP